MFVVLRLRPEKKVPASEVRLPPNSTENERVVLKEGDDIEVKMRPSSHFYFNE